MTTPEWHLRKATIMDLGFIFRVYKETMQDYIAAVHAWDEQQQRLRYEEGFRKDDYHIIQVDNCDVGVFSVLTMKTYFFLARIELLPAYQNQGIGTKILTALKTRAHAQSKPIMLHVFKSNPAINLYTRLGFKVIREDETQYEMIYNTID